LVWFGLVWFGLVWFGLVWFGLVWFGKYKKRRQNRKIQENPAYCTILVKLFKGGLSS